MRTPLMSLTLLILAACDSDCPSEDTAVEDTVQEDDCVPYDPASESWELTGQLTADGQAVVFPVSGKGTQGAGILTAELSWDWSGYDGFPSLEVSNSEDSLVGTHSYEIDQPSLSLEASLINGDTIDLVVGEFASDIEDTHYPVGFTVSLTWSDRMDCFERNNTQADAKRVVDGVVYDAYNLSSFETGSPSEYHDWSSDDFYTVTVPAGVSTMAVDVSYPVDDGSVVVYLMESGVDPYYSLDFDYVGYEHGDSKTIEMAVAPGASYDIYVARWEGLTFETWALPTEDGSARPDYWDTPYTFEVSFE